MYLCKSRELLIYKVNKASFSLKKLENGLLVVYCDICAPIYQRFNFIFDRESNLGIITRLNLIYEQLFPEETKKGYHLFLLLLLEIIWVGVWKYYKSYI